MSQKDVDRFEPGMVVEVTQQIAQRHEVVTVKVRGTVIKYSQRKTGVWYAHAKDNHLWLDRLRIRREDGEVVDLILDKYTHVDIVDESGLADAT